MWRGSKTRGPRISRYVIEDQRISGGAVQQGQQTREKKEEQVNLEKVRRGRQQQQQGRWTKLNVNFER